MEESKSIDWRAQAEKLAEKLRGVACYLRSVRTDLVISHSDLYALEVEHALQRLDWAERAKEIAQEGFAVFYAYSAMVAQSASAPANRGEPSSPEKMVSALRAGEDLCRKRDMDDVADLLRQAAEHLIIMDNTLRHIEEGITQLNFKYDWKMSSMGVDDPNLYEVAGLANGASQAHKIVQGRLSLLHAWYAAPDGGRP